MGRFLFIIGLIMTVLGFIIPFFSMGNIFGGMQPMLNLATNSDAREAELCKEGETLEEEQGSSTYTQGSGYSRSTIMYCVDADGNRRNVTGDFVQGLFGDDFMGNIGGMVGQTFLGFGLSFVGIFLMVIGGIMSMRGKTKGMLVMNPYNASFNMNPNPMPPMNQAGFSSPSAPAPQGSLAAQLKELEQAYNQNLISREEYDKARQNLLNSIK